jgi:L-alanine-DL-glutamate epimerase-like enolase superfamily enzyme
MDLMIDPASNLETFADALAVGKACDEYHYFWYEDPYRDGGTSQHAHRKLRQQLETPILQTEHVRTLESHTDFVAGEATDFVRADPEYDAGITGVMKIARVAEGFGLDVEFHAPGPAQRHCLAAVRNSNYYEMALVHPDCANTTPPIYGGDYADDLEAIADEGPSSPPRGQGSASTTTGTSSSKTRRGDGPAGDGDDGTGSSRLPHRAGSARRG